MAFRISATRNRSHSTAGIRLPMLLGIPRPTALSNSSSCITPIVAQRIHHSRSEALIRQSTRPRGAVLTPSLSDRRTRRYSDLPKEWGEREMRIDEIKRSISRLLNAEEDIKSAEGPAEALPKSPSFSPLRYPTSKAFRSIRKPRYEDVDQGTSIFRTINDLTGRSNPSDHVPSKEETAAYKLRDILDNFTRPLGDTVQQGEMPPTSSLEAAPKSSPWDADTSTSYTSPDTTPVTDLEPPMDGLAQEISDIFAWQTPMRHMDGHDFRNIGSITQGQETYSIRAYPNRLSIRLAKRDDEYWGTPKLLSYNWLRDHCRCPKCVHPSTGQKLHRTGDFFADRDLDLTTSKLEIATREGEQGLQIEWEEGHWQMARSLPDGNAQKQSNVQEKHSSFYPVHFLFGSMLGTNRPVQNDLFSHSLWSQPSLMASPNLRIPYDQIMSSNQTLFSTLMQLSDYGLVIVTGVPTDRTSNEDCELRTFMNRIGEIRNTFYGETWDVKSVAQSKNIAYTNVDLGFHQDLCYFKDPPRYQALHCLKNQVEGGSSYFADAFKAAAVLREESPDDFECLKYTRIPFVYDNDGYYYRHTHNMIRTRPLGDGDSNILEVNYSPPFQDTLTRFLRGTAPAGRLSSGYGSHPIELGLERRARAMQSFDRILDRPEARYEFTMQEGDLALFDNRRVLHARREFRDKEGVNAEEGQPTRWLKGCYMDGDVVQNKLRVLTREVFRGEWEPTQAWSKVLRARNIHPHVPGGPHKAMEASDVDEED